jgi:hypothetical protein
VSEISHSYDKKKRPKRSKKATKKKSRHSKPHKKGHAYKKAEAKPNFSYHSEEDKENEPPMLPSPPLFTQSDSENGKATAASALAGLLEHRS